MGEDIGELLTASAAMTLLLWLVFGGLLAGIMGLGYYVMCRQGSRSPWSGQSMLKGKDLTFSAVAELRAHLAAQGQPENPDFEPLKAAVCKQTGRVVCDAINRFGVIRVPRDYISRRYPGNYTAWTQLSLPEQQATAARHLSLKSFVLEGLYVDLATKTLVGWQPVPGTGLEILVVQKPQQ